MRVLQYEVLPGVGPGTILEEGTTIDLLFEIPYLIGWGRPFPTLDELNCVLQTGEQLAGMSGGCLWEPFQLSHAEYEEIVEAIKSDSRIEGLPATLDGEFRSKQ